MFTITNGFTYIAFLMFVAGGLLALEKYSKWKIFNLVPSLAWIYLLNMLFSTLGLYSSDSVTLVRSSLKDNLLYAMIFVMLLRCDFRQIMKLGSRAIAIFLACSLTLAVGLIAVYPIFADSMGGVEKTWAAVAALFASWVGGTANMAAMSTPLAVDAGAYGTAMVLDTVCFPVWVALLLLGVRYADKWNTTCKADTSKLAELAETVNDALVTHKRKATAADWVLLIGISMMVSSGVQVLGSMASSRFPLFTPSVCTTLLVTVLGLICATTPLRKLPAIENLSSVYFYCAVSLLATDANLSELASAPMWVVYGFVSLLIHVVLMLILSKLFHWDLGMVSTASLANIGGSASAPIVATAYDSSYAGIGVLMGVFGSAIGNFFSLGMGAILSTLFL